MIFDDRAVAANEVSAKAKNVDKTNKTTSAAAAAKRQKKSPEGAIRTKNSRLYNIFYI